MRTTLTLDADVAMRLKRLQQERGGTMKELVNQALRDGLTLVESASRPPRKSFRMATVDLGDCYLPNLDNVAEVLAIAEGDAFQ